MTNKHQKITLLILSLFFLVGLISHLIPILLPLMLLFTPWFLLVCGTLIVGLSLPNVNSRFWIWVVVSYILTFFLEVLGVETKAIFGHYDYGSVLGIGILGVPFIIGFNWVLVIWGALTLTSRIFKNDWLIIISAALLATGFDYILEPMAMKYGYWIWANNYIPLQNYGAWFVIALFLGFLYRSLKVKSESILSPGYFLIQLVFFAGLNFFNWLYLR